jgi:hypothetical protein
MTKSRLVGTVLCVLLSVTSAWAQNFKIGGHGSYITDGDLGKESFGGGVQIGVNLCKAVSLEISGTRWSVKPSSIINSLANQEGSSAEADEEMNNSLDTALSDQAITSIGASLKLTLNPESKFRVFIGGGANYNIIDELKITHREMLLSEALYSGMSEQDAEAIIASAIAANPSESWNEAETLLKFKNSFGWHACAGFAVSLGEHAELFAEYTHAFIKPEIEVGSLYEGGTAGKIDVEMGSARVGLNLVF